MRLLKITSLAAVALLIATTSCKKSFFTDVNNNPNVLSSVAPNLLLPTVEASLAYTIDGDISRYTSILTQQVLGANSQSQQYYIYNLNPGVFDNVWPNLYTQVMENDHTLIQVADAGGYNAYSGISRMIMAYTLQVTVDLWGDIPYSQSFTGNESKQNFHPGYDKDQALYDTIASLVDQGIAKLSLSDPGPIAPAGDDGIYQGDADRWIKFGHAIKARLAIHQSKNDAAKAAAALSEIAQSFTSNSDNAVYVFGSEETAANSWYQFYRDRPGDISWEGSTFAEALQSDNDPRYGVYDLDSLTPKGDPFSYYNRANSPFELITYDELQFMKAEAALRSSPSDPVTAQAAYTEAITANFDKLGIASGKLTTYLAGHGVLPAGDAGIAKVANEEYKALFLNPEAFTLYRRTGEPDLTPTGGSAIPRRLLYPQSELDYNGDNTPSVTLYSPKIFWDK